MSVLQDIAQKAVVRHEMLPARAPALVMVSGGGDSVALLRLFASGAFGERPLRVLHINHLLRGAESDADEAFVRDLCEQVGVACEIARSDAAAYAAAEGLNLEDAGRRIRYRFADEMLDAWCAELGVDSAGGRIATAHTRDDRIETFFMRAISGAGAGALSGIRPVRGRVVRPLIEADRAEVREWLETRGGAWREDASNADETRTRALVRARIIPAAAEINPAFRATLARTLDLLGDEDTLLSGMAEAFVRDFATVEPGSRVSFHRAPMLTLDRTMARRVVRTAVLGCFPESSRLDSFHVEALVDGLAEDGFARDLPDGLRAVSEYDSMVILRRGADRRSVAPALLPLPGIAELGAAGRIVAEKTSSQDRAGDARSVVIDADAVRAELTVDGRREGDRMRPLGMLGTRKLSDLLVDEKVPERVRDAMPVVRDGEMIVWLAGVRMAEEYRVTDSTVRAYRLTWSGGEDEPDARSGLGEGTELAQR